MIGHSVIEAGNATRQYDLARDYETLGERLARRGVEIEALTTRAATFGVAIPSWGTGTGGTRFARFPGAGEPAGIMDKLDDCGTIHRLTAATPRVSLHIPWDKADPGDLLAKAEQVGIGFDAMNSNSFQDQPGQPLSYKYGSLSHTDAATRQQAVEHNLECIEIGRKIGSKALTVWIGDGSNFPGQTSLSGQFDRYLDAMTAIYAGLPDDWRIFSEHKIYEPAFYSTVMQDWGSSLMTAQELGPKAQCLVDLGHHAPNVNIEMIVARLIRAGKLGGFHFNDSKYGDDDLDSGTIDPFRLFLVFNELVELEDTPGLNLSHMIDQSHNVTDPIESLMVSACEIQRAFVQASLVDRAALRDCQQANDALMA
ncbi:L-rhamnose catabolism isomerase, partial [Paracoccus sp. (in: a-proteobacteria)]|uniref:L-rhamnose catabolism isomerase n=1 Tax=Paracoccus sp. TaxID=267 RepID=UPI003A846DBD